MDALHTTTNLVPHTSKKRWLITAAIIVLVAVLAIIIYMRQTNNSAQAAATSTVTITGSSFDPATIHIAKGGSVTWLNQDVQPHYIMANPDPSGQPSTTLNSGEPLATGESYTTFFEKSGTYAYHDQLNLASFKATVIVE